MYENETTLNEPIFEDREPLLDTAEIEVELEEASEEDVDERVDLELTAESLFSSELGQTVLLSREEEAHLARRIARARNRVRRILRQARQLCDCALEDGGRGVVRPEDDFREQETIDILAFARAAMLERRPALTTGLRKPELRKWITELTIALDEYRVLRDEMLEANVRLVTMLARQYRHPTLSFLDFVQEGTLGLIRAIEKYEPSRKVKFSTYAVWWIWQQIARSADNQGALIRTPVHWNQMRREVGRRSRSGDIGEAHAELAHHRGMDQDRIATMAQTFRFVSTDQPASDDDERPLETLVADEQETPDARVLQADLRELVAEAVAQLPPREAEILYQRFGLRDDCARTLDEIGTHFGVSRERIRQLESRALRQLKEVCRARGLDAYLN